MEVKYKKIIVRAVVFILLVYLVFQLTSFVASNESIQSIVAKFGYWGMFMAALVSGFNVIVPIPIAAFVPLFIESGFDFRLSIMIITVGMTLGDSINYFIGLAGRRFVLTEDSSRGKWIIKKLIEFKETHYILPYLMLSLYVSFAPLPNELIVIPMGFLGYRFSIIFPIVFAGNIIFNTYVSLGFIRFFGI